MRRQTSASGTRTAGSPVSAPQVTRSESSTQAASKVRRSVPARPPGRSRIAAPGLDVLVGVGHAEAAGDQRGALAAEDADGLAQVVDLARALGFAAQDVGNAGALQLHAGQLQAEGVQPLQQLTQTGGVHMARLRHAGKVLGA